MKQWTLILVELMMAFALTSSRTVSAKDIELAIMPGEVIAGHADLEPECSSCHKKFSKPAQRQLCMDCHEDVAADINVKRGFHGLFPEARDEQCAVCHTEHIGRAANIVVLDEATFDHDFTDYKLTGSHAEAECVGCHVPDARHRMASSYCNDCHNEDDVHKETLGTECGDCHQSTEWKDATFDHDTTDYPLLGKHQETACLDCHEDETYLNAPTTCYGCHAEDDAHDGRSGKKCEKCHNPSDWNDSSFDHARDTEFPLQGRHAELTCNDCHSDDPFQDEMDKACVACHLEDDEHAGHNGEQCETCHESTDWSASTFDHGRDTDYYLLGSHETVACVDCHVEPIFEVELGTTCASCHLEDEPHEGALGDQCDQCHTEVSWEDPVFFDHDLTAFPLLGKHRENECEDCHATQEYTNAEPDCVSCHREDDAHRGNFGESCNACHNPVAWNIWTFDHNAQTDFPLEGAHNSVGCDGCHRRSLEKMKRVRVSCGNCHRADDVHDGEFGFNCGRCHSADTFSEVRAIQ